MLTDNELRLSGARTATAVAFTDGVPSGYPAGQAITSSAASTNIIDLKANRDIGEGEAVYAVFTITEAFNTLTSLDFDIRINNDEDMTTTPTTLVTFNKLLAALTLGAQFAVQIPPVLGSLGLRYLGAYYTVNGSNPSTGKIVADIVIGVTDAKKFYPSGFSV